MMTIVLILVGMVIVTVITLAIVRKNAKKHGRDRIWKLLEYISEENGDCWAFQHYSEIISICMRCDLSCRDFGYKDYYHLKEVANRSEERFTKSQAHLVPVLRQFAKS